MKAFEMKGHKQAGTLANNVPTLSIIIPTFNEAGVINQTLDSLMEVPCLEVLVVDGGSFDQTRDLVRQRDVTLIRSERGRGAQMHAGAVAAHGDVFWFLHADTRVSPSSTEQIAGSLLDPRVVAGSFDLRFDGDSWPAWFLTGFYRQMRKFGLWYGDSALFVRREVYQRAGGFQPYPIFEDLDLIRRLRRIGRIVNLQDVVTTSSRRFEGRSFILTFASWIVLQILFWVGVHPLKLARLYAPIRSSSSEDRKVIVAKTTGA